MNAKEEETREGGGIRSIIEREMVFAVALDSIFAFMPQRRTLK
jgi:hypothetical protein